MSSATISLAAGSGAHRRGRTRGLRLPGSVGLAALLGVLALALAGPAGASTRSAVPSPQPAPSTTGSGGPAPDPTPQATAAGVSGSSEATTSQTNASQGSGSSSVSAPVPAPSTVPVAPQSVQSAASTAPDYSSATAGRPARARGPRNHPGARVSTRQRERALAEQQFRHRLALELRTAPVVGTITSATARRDGTLLLVGAAFLFLLASASGVLLRRLWRLHGQWYGGRPA